jgi:hypothetical protein
MDILTKINTLPNEIQNLIFYFVILKEEANLIKNIDWKKEYKNTFFKTNILNRFVVNDSNIYGRNICVRKIEILTNENGLGDNYRTIGKSWLERVGFKAFDYKDKQKYVLIQECINNGITKFNKNDRISMIKKLMKI